LAKREALHELLEGVAGEKRRVAAPDKGFECCAAQALRGALVGGMPLSADDERQDRRIAGIASRVRLWSR
jgi:hypothetical protein